jgi:hypothetical protein
VSEIAYVIRAMRLDDYAVVQLLVNIDAATEQEVEIAGVGNGFNDNGAIAVAFPQYEFEGVADDGSWLFNYARPVANQVMYQNPGADVTWYAVDPYGTLEWNPVCTWVTNSDVTQYLGVSFTAADDTGYLTKCVSAANQFCYRRRLEAGYLTDELHTSPGGDVTLGTIMVAAAYFRQRGAYNSLANFDGMGVTPPPGITPVIMQLLGINRPQVA